jgi:hypothetical protein
MRGGGADEIGELGEKYSFGSISLRMKGKTHGEKFRRANSGGGR